ncbi:hypothetical protein QFC22_004367 [Naganishia vaughanmartiniae]|uniref:Uncharacterized protein n=1 Tax=Naganishia vaughanmartiniae TaxID=1424756 RepID=A0ACC2X0W9_9TREE|nr:hypothetical protein QFC22_004367 [Naganishia vaughanmartiniae]
MSSFQELLQQKQKEADRQKQIREKQAKLEAERAEKEKAERIEREKQEEERARQLRAAARRKEQDDAEKARKAALLKEKIERDRAQQKPSLLTKSASRASSVSSKTKSTTVRIKSNPSASSSTAGTKAPVLTREEKRKLKEDREFGVTAPNAAVKVKMTEGDRVARMLAAATAGRGLNAKIPERAHVRRSEIERENGSSSSRAGPSASASSTANRTGPTYKAQSSVAHHTSSKPVKGVDRLQEGAKVLASSNVSKDRRSIDEIQRDMRAGRNMDEDRGFFGQESAKASSTNSERRMSGKLTSQRVPDRPVGSTSSASAGPSSRMKQSNTQPQHTEDTSYIINKMGLATDERESHTRSRHDQNGPTNGKSTPSKRRRQRSYFSDDSDQDAGDQDFDSDDLDDVDIRRKKKKSKSNGIGRTREVSPPPRQKKRPMGGSVLAAAGLDIYKMFGRKDREFYLSRDRASDSEDDMEADAATIRKEEARAARQAREDDRREEEAERKRAAEKKRRMDRGR